MNWGTRCSPDHLNFIAHLRSAYECNTLEVRGVTAFNVVLTPLRYPICLYETYFFFAPSDHETNFG